MNNTIALYSASTLDQNNGIMLLGFPRNNITSNENSIFSSGTSIYKREFALSASQYLDIWAFLLSLYDILVLDPF